MENPLAKALVRLNDTGVMRIRLAVPLLFLSLALARISVLTQLASANGASIPGIVTVSGLLQDLSLAALCGSFAVALRSVLGLPSALGFGVPALFAWVATLANALYYGFFSSRLDTWIIRTHWHDALQISGSAARLSWDPAIIASAAVFILSLAMGALPRRQDTARALPRPLALGAAAALLVLALLLKQSPVWFHGHTWDPGQGGFRGNIGSEQILYVWWDQLRGVTRDTAATQLSETELDRLARTLHSFRELAISEPGSKPPGMRELRVRLGLPSSGPIHIVVIMLESTRAYEFNEPWLASRVVPQLSEIIRRNGIYFRQAYSSALESGQTARGLFSTFCGTLPNIGGPAVYIAYSDIRAECLQSFLAAAGYATSSIQIFKKAYHNALAFESLHGTQNFFDMLDVLKNQPSAITWDWGVDETSYFKEALEIIRSQARGGRAVFTHLRTNSTHHPFYTRSKAPFPADVAAKTTGGEHLDYLRAVHHSDETVAAFIRALLASELGANTLIVLQADHSLLREIGGVVPLAPHQVRELKSRIPLALITRDLTRPEIVHSPVHQVDVAPTLAAIAGVNAGGSWLGRSLFQSGRSAWIFEGNEGISYRVGGKSCYGSLKRANEMLCYATLAGASDPLMQDDLKPAEPDPALEARIREILEANRILISRNRLVMPPARQ